MKRLATALFIALASALPVTAGTFLLGTVDHQITGHLFLNVETDADGGVRGVSGYAEAVGLGCVVSRYCELGSLSVTSRDGSVFMDLDTRMLAFEDLRVDRIDFGPDVLTLTSETADLTFFVPSYPPAASYEEYLKRLFPATRAVFRFAGLGDFRSFTGYSGRDFEAPAASVAVELITPVPLPASGLVLASAFGALAWARRRRRG